jgi:hypothetical protein
MCKVCKAEQEAKVDAEFYERLEKNEFDDGNISVTLPSVRKTLSVSDLEEDEYPLYDLEGVGGVYTFYDKYGNPLYVGITSDFKQRIKSHIAMNKRAQNNWKLKALMLYGVPYQIELRYVSSARNRDIYETYMINELEPFCNISKAESCKNGRAAKRMDIGVVREYNEWCQQYDDTGRI